nr:mitochondrial substrate carrier family protein ucpB isoform X2 [Ipomoea batatas]
MGGDSASGETLLSVSGSSKVKQQRQKWGVSASDVAYHFGTSGVSVAAATAITHPLGWCIGLEGKAMGIEDVEDVLKVRLQMQLVGQRGPLTGMGKLSAHVVRNEGLGSLYRGLSPALMRSILYGGLRLGLYEPSKYVAEMTFESSNIIVKIASGAFSGAVATALTNPVEVLKVRLQMNTKSNRGPIRELQKIASREGALALWKGVGPAMARAAALTASQLATYDESKRVLLKWTSLEEGLYLHLISSTIAGTVSTLITAPMDMVKTRLMLQRESNSAGMYKSGLHCAYQWPCNIREIGSTDNDYLHNLREAAQASRIEGNLGLLSVVFLALLALSVAAGSADRSWTFKVSSIVRTAPTHLGNSFFFK